MEGEGVSNRSEREGQSRPKPEEREVRAVWFIFCE